MKTQENNSKLHQGITYNPELDQYTDKILFPEKVEYAKQLIKKVGLPKELQKRAEKISQ